jgi:hypothetical protein
VYLLLLLLLCSNDFLVRTTDDLAVTYNDMSPMVSKTPVLLFWISSMCSYSLHVMQPLSETGLPA